MDDMHKFQEMKFIFLILITILLGACSNKNGSKIVLYDAPAEESKSDDFEMFVNNRPVFVYQARVSKYPINQIWPGFQRPINQTEIAAFSYFDFEGEVEIRIISKVDIKTMEIRPKEFGIIPTIKDNEIIFNISEPLQFVVEVNGYHKALHVFANPVSKFNIDKDNARVHYFGPGIHDAGIINMKSDETVYIDGGAIVYGIITCENVRNVNILGRGILDASKFERNNPSMINMNHVVNGNINGIILRDPHHWATRITNCDSITIDNIKLIGFWRYNSDGVNLVNCKNIVLKNSFIRSFDDNIVVRGSKSAYHEPYNIIENIQIDNCVLWNDWGRALEIGADTFADTIKNISYTNVYIPRFTTVAMDIQNCSRGYIKDILYENIYIEEPITDSIMIGSTPIVKNAWGKIIVLGIYDTFYGIDTIRGNINNITFNNIIYNRRDFASDEISIPDTVPIDKNDSRNKYDLFIRDNMYFGDIKFNATGSSDIYLHGFDDRHVVSNIYIKNFLTNGKKITTLNAVGRNEFVRNVFLE